MPESQRASVIGFGPFQANWQARELRKHGIKVKLSGQPFEVLTLLLERPGEVVTHEELRAKLWQADTFVDFEHGLHAAVNKLREALGDSAEHPRYVETLPRRGYRFVAPVLWAEASAEESAREKHEPEYVATAASLAQRTRVFGRLGATLLGAAGVLVALGFVYSTLRDARQPKLSAAPGIHSVAVLPLENLSRDPEQEYFADGMTDELITDLAKIGALRVISRTSVMGYKGTKKSLPEIARELNVDAVVEGRVSRSPGRVHITAQLVQARPEQHLWAESYDRPLDDAVILESELAREIAYTIRVKLTPQEQARLASARPLNPQAHENYLKGLFQLNKRTGPDARRAITYFDEAIKKEPQYASAYVAMADAYRTLTFNSSFAPADVLPRSEDAAKHALALDDQLAEAHASLAATIGDYDWDWRRAESELQTALRLNPNSSVVHAAYAHVLRQEGDSEGMIREARRSVELDPVNVLGNFFIGQGLLEARHYGQATAQLRETLVLNANFWPAHLYLGMTFLQQGDYIEAIEELRKAGDLTAEPYATMGYVYARMGRLADALKVLADLKERSKHQYVAPSHIAKIYIALGDREQAFTWLEKGYQQRDSWLTFLKGDPMYDPIRSDPRFQDLLRRIGLPT